MINGFQLVPGGGPTEPRTPWAFQQVRPRPPIPHECFLNPRRTCSQKNDCGSRGPAQQRTFLSWRWAIIRIFRDDRASPSLAIDFKRTGRIPAREIRVK